MNTSVRAWSTGQVPIVMQRSLVLGVSFGFDLARVPSNLPHCAGYSRTLAICLQIFQHDWEKRSVYWDALQDGTNIPK
jgi:hypothetical protein